uniref:Uncharacterized protein n=1 Tax=Myotis myotis TaxID=51298 RepID=A0A7J7ZXF0_MYOMY|nr:hypothetical protein mMyoMyo1_009704 [Myotis myotis]
MMVINTSCLIHTTSNTLSSPPPLFSFPSHKHSHLSQVQATWKDLVLQVTSEGQTICKHTLEHLHGAEEETVTLTKGCAPVLAPLLCLAGPFLCTHASSHDPPSFLCPFPNFPLGRIISLSGQG